jgi:cytochrome c5
MRIEPKLSLAVGVTAALLLPALLLLVPASGTVALAQTGAAPDGKAVFLAQKCEMCHGVSTAGIEAKTKSAAMAGPDLVDLAPERDAAWISQYLKKEVQLEGKDHKKAFSGTDEELKALVDWLLAQKTS